MGDPTRATSAGSTAPDAASPTVLVLGDQLSFDNAALRLSTRGRPRVLMVESASALDAPYHRQRLHLVTAAMRRFTASLRAEGHVVDYRSAATFSDALASHRADHPTSPIVAMEPTSWEMEHSLRRHGVDLIRTNQFLCTRDEFAEWAAGRPRLVMEDFYRWNRARLGYLMDGDQPAGGRWNFDAENRQPPPAAAVPWPSPPSSPLDELDLEVIDELSDHGFGAHADGTWATSRAEALRRLETFVRERLPSFGPHQDAMVSEAWSMRHSLLSPYLNLGLLSPAEVCDAVEAAYRAGHVPIASAEGFIRQVIGWREFINGVYWLWMPDYRSLNMLDATRELPPAFTGAGTDMRCLGTALEAVDEHAYAHHIQRLMVIANLGLLAAVDPDDMTDWMRRSFIDGSDWAMQPNVRGMGLHADGGRMATKPYAAGGNYINRMSDSCADCRYDPKQRTGPDACPFSTLYWDFLDRNAPALSKNHRLGPQMAGLRKRSDLPEIRRRADEVLGLLDEGEL